MKRAVVLVLLFIACIAGFLTVKGIFPFIPVLSDSMEPALRYGSLLAIKPVNPDDIKLGDVIIYNVPPAMRKYYNYPAVVSRRVIEIKTAPSLGFRTKGDNAGLDPFTIGPADIRGTAGTQISYLGLPLLFFESPQGLISVAFTLAMLAVLLYSREGTTLIFRRILAPLMNKKRIDNREAVGKIASSEKKINTPKQTQPKHIKAVKEKSRPPFAPVIKEGKRDDQVAALKSEPPEEKKVDAKARTQPHPVKTAEETPKPFILPVVNEEKYNDKAAARIIEASEKKVDAIEQSPLQLKKPAKETMKTIFPALNKSAPPKDDRKQEELPEEAMSAEKTLFEALDRLNNMLKKTKS
jgi:signal peptidase I